MKKAASAVLLLLAIAGCTSRESPARVSQSPSVGSPLASPLTRSTTQPPSRQQALPASAPPSAGSALATTFSVMQGSTTCAAQTVMAGTAGSPGESLAGCDGTVGSPEALKVVPAAVDQPVYIQLSGQRPIKFTVSPTANAHVDGLTITPLRSGTITVTLTSGLFCAFVPAAGRQPTSCTLMLIRVPA